MQWRDERSMDWNALVRLVLLMGLTAFLLKLVLSGEIKWYIHPRFTWFTASAAAGLVLMAFGQMRKALRGAAWPGPPLRSRLYVAITVVLCVGFLIRPTVFGADLASKQGMNLTKRGAAPASVTTPVVTPSPAPDPTGSPAAPAGGTGQVEPAQPATPAAPAAANPVVETITVNTKNFVPSMTDFYSTPGKFVGKRIVMEGFVFHPPETGPEEWALTRLVVTCHVAHAYPDGLLATVPGQPKPAEDGWFRLEGTLEQVVHMGVPALRIQVEQMTALEAPADPYVYP